ncbi:MAG: DUF4198 domain-containing protein [Hyphomonas sp.]|nr:DUF4198 domain-containing protein [Hyphomonas sp.]
MNRSRLHAGALALASCLVFAAPVASAHVSYLLPSTFTVEVDTDTVTVQAAFSEEFGLPAVALNSPEFSVYLPDGSRSDFAKSATFAQMSVLDAVVEAEGTYRLTSGERVGRKGTQVFVADQWAPLEPGTPVAEGAKTRPSQTATVTDVYLTKGKPTKAVIDVSVGRLTLKPLTHPNLATTQSGFDFEVLLDGEPVANQVVFVDRFGDAHYNPATNQMLTTDDDGRAGLATDRAGIYRLMTRLSADAPPGSETRIRSYTTSIVLEIKTAD